MTELTEEQLIYLLCTKAYAKPMEAGTLTKSEIKSYLPDECKEKAEDIYGDLKNLRLIELKTKDGKTTDKKGKAITRDGRFSITGEGNQVLIENLTTTNYDFTSSKSYKLLTTVLTCLLTYIEEIAEPPAQTKQLQEMAFEEFQEKFKALYLKERKQQELSGVVAIHKGDLLERFQDANSGTLSPKKLENYFEELKSGGTVFLSKGEKDELIHWVE